MHYNGLKATFIGILVFSILLYLRGWMDESLLWGRSVGPSGVLLIAGVIAISVFIATSCCFIVFGGKRWTWARSGKHFLFIFIASAAADFCLIGLGGNSGKFGEKLLLSKVDYFCVENFAPGPCIQQMEVCRDCVQKIDRWKRLKIAESLRAMGNGYNTEYLVK